MNINKRSVWNILKRVVFTCATFLVIIAILAVAEVIGKVVFNIVMSTIYVLGVLGIAFVLGKLTAKLLAKGLHYIEQRKNKK